MRKFKRIYFVVPFLTAMILMAGEKDVAAFTARASTGAKAGIFQKDTVPQKSIKDTLPVKDSLKIADSSKLATDTGARAKTDTFRLKISKDTLSGPVKYSGQDSIVGFLDSKKINLYGKAKTEYQDLTLTAPEIGIDQENHIVTAKAGRDSTGEIADYAEMKQGQEEYKSEGMEYNIKTQQGITKGTITQQGEMYVHSEIAKKIDARTMYGQGTFFTTCNLDHPHFGFRARRAKIINKKLAVTGSVRPEFDSVPVPIYLPFGIYPLYQGRHSGMMSPSFERNDQMGLGLSRMGYYQVINDHWDVQAYGNIYSYGSWMFNVQPTYRKIYKYQGSMNFGLQRTRRNFKGDPDFSKVSTYTLNWAHSSDSRSRPGVSFSANVNMSSTRYNENVPNSNLLNMANNTAGSSITYAKTWQDKPFNFTASFNHNQNNAARLVTFNFPNMAFTVNTIYPFQKKNAAGSRKWYEQLGIGFQTGFQNSMSYYEYADRQKDSLKGLSLYKNAFERMWDTLQWNANQSIPISLSLPPILGGAVMISPSISYSQNMVSRIADYSVESREMVNEFGQTVVYDTVIAKMNRGIGLRKQMSMGVSLNTALYGTYQFRNKRVQGIRHVIRPTISLNYTPDINKDNFQPVTVRTDTTISTVYYDRLAGLYSSPLPTYQPRRFGGVNFGIDNNLEMKVKAKKKKKAEADSTDSETESGVDENGFKKIRLIEGFGITSSYNLFADSLSPRLAPFNLYFRTNLFEKINISANGTIMPYKLDANGIPKFSEYAWQGRRFNIGTLTNASITMSTSFQSKPKDANKAKQREEALNQQMNDPMLQGDQQRLLEYMRQNPAEFVDFNTPWSINLSYSLTYSRPTRTSGAYAGNGINSSTNFNGSFNLTPKWNFSVNGAYDFKTKQIQTVGFTISRDLHCWQLSASVSPVGIYKYYNFTISPKSGMLQDLKINRNRSFFNGGPRY
ncbi:putative LPS assembly protein LptD [Niabella aurantiaca]|uniref:putative LPS assembly protein LptD n=1 Tax=Niabella aurantiaca TaxID=379900 RepID=UPI000374A416|nr:putative LPS assembly protein LptD [Niabella aurantiaca]